MTAPIRKSLEVRLKDLDRRIATLDAQREDDNSLENTALMEQLTRERDDIAEALRDAKLIDDEPFDAEAIEVGDTVTIRDSDGETERYVLVDGKFRSRARSDWVSVSSPLGAAIIGRSKGQSVRVESPSGPMNFVIVDFERASEGVLQQAAARAQPRSRTLKLLPSEAFLG
jgi:transcription elongation factor GreA